MKKNYYNIYRKNPKAAVEQFYIDYYHDIQKICNLDFKTIDDIKNVSYDLVKLCIENAFKDNSKDLLKDVCIGITEKIQSVIAYSYAQSEQVLSFDDYFDYSMLIYSMSEEDMVSYENAMFTINGESKTELVDRIYDSAMEIYRYYSQAIQNEGDMDEYYFVMDRKDKVIKLLEEGFIDDALKTLVALQLYTGIGTKFIRELKKFIKGEYKYSITEILDLDNGLGKGKGPRK